MEIFLTTINFVGLQQHLMAMDGETIEAAISSVDE